MSKPVFVIKPGHPIVPDDCRTEVSELHVHVVFYPIAGFSCASLCDYLNNYPGIEGGVTGFETDCRTGKHIVDVAMVAGEDSYTRAAQKVRNGVSMCLLHHHIDAEAMIIQMDK